MQYGAAAELEVAPVVAAEVTGGVVADDVVADNVAVPKALAVHTDGRSVPVRALQSMPIALSVALELAVPVELVPPSCRICRPGDTVADGVGAIERADRVENMIAASAGAMVDGCGWKLAG